MSDFLLDPFLEPARAAGHRDDNGWGLLQAEMARQAVQPPSGDRKLAAMWYGVQEFLADEPDVRNFVTEWATHQKPGVPISERAGKLGAAVRLVCLPPIRGFFDERFLGSTAWRQELGGMMSDMTKLAAFGTGTCVLPVNTTTDKRYGPLEVVRQAQFGFKRRRIGTWDGGCSVRIGANWLILKDEFSLPRTRIVRPSGRTNPDGSEQFITDDAADATYHELLGGASLPGEIVCADIWSYRDEQARQFARAALRPQELSDPIFMRRFYRLRDAQLKRVHFEEIDITQKAEMALIREKHRDKRLKVGFLGTVLNQIGDEDVPSAIDLSLDVLDDDGTLFIMEFGYVDPIDRSRFHLHPVWSEWTYGLFAIHKADPTRTIHELLRFRTSRCEEAQVGSGSLLINGKYVPMADLLHTHPPEAFGD